jgi:hypothetical protein
MVTIRHINKEVYAAKALNLLNCRWEGYVNYALGLMQDNVSPGAAGERLEKKVCSEMENALFNYLQRSGKVSGGYKHQYYHVTGYYRTVHREPQKREVPAELLDIKRVLANYEEVIGNIMADAEKRWIEAEAERFAKEANENE